MRAPVCRTVGYSAPNRPPLQRTGDTDALSHPNGIPTLLSLALLVKGLAECTTCLVAERETFLEGSFRTDMAFTVSSTLIHELSKVVLLC